MIEHLPEMLDAGIDSLKVEGRMKTALYVATVARAYRHAIDDYRTDPELFKERLPWYHERIAECTYRQYTTGFFFGKPTDEAQIYDNNTYIRAYTYLGLIRDFDENGLAVVEQKNKFYAGDEIEIMKPDGRNIRTRVLEIRDASGEMMESCPHAGQELHLLLSEKPEAYDILRAAGNVENA